MERIPDFVAIGHATRDVFSDTADDWRLGGTVTFAALTATRLGLHTAIVTSGPPDVLVALQQTLPGVAIHALPAPAATTYQNDYYNGLRQQYLRGRAATISLADIPLAWQKAPVILLAPLADELEIHMAAALSKSTSLLAATPQGWLRHFAADGYVTPQPFTAAPHVLPYVQALILSREDVLPPAHRTDTGERLPQTSAEAEALLASWAHQVPLVAVTRGPTGALLYQHSQQPELYPGYPAYEIDPTGAGDVFAAAFLCQLAQTGDAPAAMDFANRVAACSVEYVGIDGIPTRAQVAQRFGSTNS